jgi:medium-chain acyl-[acyl-carrier-protein] hydrolase
MMRKFLHTPKPATAATLRLFCFPHAGGGAVIYRGWQPYFPGSVQICPIEIPGRGWLGAECLPDSVVSLADEIAEALAPYLDAPYALFGHSMGALIAYEVARRLELVGGRLPEKLFASGARAPFLPSDKPPVSHLPDADFVAHLRELNGTTDDILGNRELMEIMAPVLRADFGMCERYRPRETVVLNTPITALYGSRDTSVSAGDADAWRQVTRGAFQCRGFSGDHFFIRECVATVADAVAGELASQASAI